MLPDMSELQIQTLRGAEVSAHLAPLAQLRIEVFRDWPYLYQGSLEYERNYLKTYAQCERSLIVLVRDGERCVGASTALPLSDAEPAMQAPFLERGMPVADISYFGESLVLPAWRGRGLGVKFFELREAHALSLGLSLCTFCAVSRPDDHPMRPAGYVPNDAFWQRRGYSPVPDMQAHYEWTDLDQQQATSKPMQFWSRRLSLS